MCARRVFASAIIVARRAALASRVAIWPIHPVAGIDDQRAALIRVLGGLEALAIALAGELVLEELADLGEGEPGVVAQALDEAQPLEVARVVQAVGAIGAGGRLEQADLLVIADRAGRQAGLGGDFLDLEEWCVDGGVARGRRGGGGQGHLPPTIPQP